ncbi:hypothetical protein [Saccharopolyspora sp. NPDC002376]
MDRLNLRDAQKWANKLHDICQCCKQGKDARRPKKRQRCCAWGMCCSEAPSTRTVSDVRKITVHARRASCAMVLVDLEVHPRVTMQILHHADFK